MPTPADPAALPYDRLVAQYERATAGDLRFLHVRREGNAAGRLVVTFAAHNNGQRYSSVAGLLRGMTADIAAFRDPGNSYYHFEDAGAGVGEALRGLAETYGPARMLLFGSSMAGYAALRWALELGANCVANNPQVNLDASIPLAWADLQANLQRIPRRVNLDELDLGPRRAVLTVIHGRHRLDLENMRRLFALWLRVPGMLLRLHQVDEAAHGYLIRDFAEFQRLAEETFEARAQLEARAAPAPALAPPAPAPAPPAA